PANAQVLWSNTANNDPLTDLTGYMPGTDLGIDLYPTMYFTFLGQSYNVDGTNAYAKECTTIQLEPSGIGGLIGNGLSSEWKMIQLKTCHEFVDGRPNISNDCYNDVPTDDGLNDWRN